MEQNIRLCTNGLTDGGKGDTDDMDVEMLIEMILTNPTVHLVRVGREIRHKGITMYVIFGYRLNPSHIMTLLARSGR